MFGIETKVDKHLVHKSHDDDVLIYNARPWMPAWFAADVLERAELDAEGLQAVLAVYRREGDRCVLGALPQAFAAQALEDHGLAGCLEEVEQAYVREGDRFVLTGQWVLECTEAKLGRLVPGWTRPDPEARRRAHALLDGVAGFPYNGLQYYTVYNDTKNYFFYRKHHEHVPGLMLIEVARQAMYAQFYAHSGYARGEVSISIIDLLSSFPRYTESSYTVDVLVGDHDEQPQSRARKVDKRARFFQAGERVADIRLRGEVIKMSVFKRMRNVAVDPAHWFRPLKGIGREALLRLDCGRHLDTRVEYLSLGGVQLRCAAPLEDPAGGYAAPGQLYLYLEHFGLMPLPVDGVEVSGDDNGTTLRVRLASLDTKLRYQWREVLKQFAYFSHREDAAGEEAARPAARQLVGQA